MARIKKYSPEQKLSSFQTFLVDDNPNSDYFRITEFKDTFTGGKNGFLIEGSEYLKESTEIKIEILDVEGNTVYYEPGNGIPEYYEGISKLVAVYVYNDTPIGLGKITILGELKEYDENGVKRTIPDEWKGAYNVKWERTFQINKLLANEDKVRFYRRPDVSIDEFVKPIFSGNPPTVTQTGSVSGIPLAPSENQNLSNFSLPTSYRLNIDSGDKWTGSIVGQPINFTNLNYTPIVDDVVNGTELIVSPPYTENDLAKSFNNEEYSVTFPYIEGVTDLATALTGSFAKISITDMKTFVGDAARVKVFRRSQSNLTDFEFVQEIQLESNELLKDITTFDKKEENYGIFTEDILDSYWITSSNDFNISFNQDFLYNSVNLDSTPTNYFFTSESFSIGSGVEYSLDFNVRKETTDPNAYLKVFLSGSNNDKGVEQQIINIPASTTILQKTNFSENIVANDFDNAKLYFEVSGSDWYVNNVSLKASQETSFSPDEITFIQQVPKTLVSETFDYRFEFYDINNNYIPVRVEETKTFTGGNTNLFNKSLDITPDNLYFSFDSASNPANAVPPFVINFDVETNLVTGSITYTSGAYDFFGNEISQSEYAGGIYPGYLTNWDVDGGRQPFLRVQDFTGSRDDISVQFIRYNAEVEGVTDTFVITRVEDGKGGVSFEIVPFRGTQIKNKEDKTLEIQAVRVDGINRIDLQSGLARGFSDAKLHLLSSSLDGTQTYVSLSQAITDPNFIEGVSAGTTGSGEIDYNAIFTRDSIDNELTVYLMDGPTSESILTSQILTDLKDGLNNGIVTSTTEQFNIKYKPREINDFNPLQSIVTASFQRRGTTLNPLSASLLIIPSSSKEPKTELPHYYMFYETGAFDSTITLSVTDFAGNVIDNGVPGNGIPYYSAIDTKQLNLEFTYTEPITSASVTANKSFFITPDGLPGQDSIVIDIDPQPVSLGSNHKGEVYNYALANTDIQLTQGDLFLINTASGDPGTFTTRSIVTTNIEYGTLVGDSTTTMSLAGFETMSALSASVRYDFDIYPYFTSSLVTASRTQKFTKVVDGGGPIEVTIEPMAVALNADEIGYVSNYSSATTEVFIKQNDEFFFYDEFDGGRPGTFVTQSITQRNIQFSEVSSSFRDLIASGSVSSSDGEILHFKGFGGLANNQPSGSITYKFKVYPYSLTAGVGGVPRIVSATQTFSKVSDGTAARKVSLIASSDTVIYDGDGLKVAPVGDVDLSAIAINVTGSAFFKFLNDDGSTIQASSTDSTTTIGDLPSTGSAKTFTVELRDGNPNGVVVDTDTVTISGISEGSTAYSAVVTNPASSITVEVDGTTFVENTSTLIRAYKGGTELQYVEEYDEAALDPITFLPIGTFGQFSASIHDISPFLTHNDGRLLETSGELYASSSGISDWTEPQSNTQGFIVYKLDFENGRGEQFVQQSFSAVFEGATGPGIVMRGEWTGSIAYIFDQGNQRRDAVLRNVDGTTHYWATTQLIPSGSEYTDGDDEYTPEPQLPSQTNPDGTYVEGTIDTNGWEYLGQQELFVAAKIAIFDESFVKNTINVGEPTTDYDTNPQIAIVGGTDEPYISIGQSIQGYGQQGAYIGVTNNGGPTGTAGTSGLLSLSGDPTEPSYNSLKWDGQTLLIRGAIRQTAAGSIEPQLRGDWTDGAYYNTDDSVLYLNQSFRASAPHTASQGDGVFGEPNIGDVWDASSGVGKTATLAASTFVIEFDQDGNNPSPSSINLIASSSNFVNPFFKFTGGGTFHNNDVSFYDGNDVENHLSSSIDLSSATISDMPLQFRLGVSDADQVEVVSDVINIFGVKPGSDTVPNYFITPIAGGTQIKNSSGTITLQVQKADISGITDITSGTDAQIYDGGTLLAVQSGVSDAGNGVVYNPNITSDFITGTKTLLLKDNGGTVLDSITLLDVTDGLGGGSFIAPNLKTNRNTSVTPNTFSPSYLSATASFYDTSGTEYTQSVTITPSFSVGVDRMAVSTGVGDTTNITITAGDGDGGTITLGGASVPTKDTVLTAIFTDPATGQTNTINETFYIVSDGVDGVDAITVINTNQAHTLPASSAGVVSSYTDSGTVIRVFEGVLELYYTNGTPSDGEFTISATQSPSGVMNTPSIDVEEAGEEPAEVADFTSMDNAQDSVIVTYTITGLRSGGASFTSTTTQTLTKVKDGTDGEDGGVVYAGEWKLTLSDGTTPTISDKVVYLAEDNLKYVTKYNNSYYICATTHRYAGAWDGSEDYLEGDVVLESGTYYRAGQDILAGDFFPGDPEWPSVGSSIEPGTWTAGWESFGAEFTSVATDILFAQDVYADRTINIGSNGSSAVIQLNADTSNSNQNPFLSIGQNGTEGYGNPGMFFGFDSGSEKLSISGSGGALTFDGNLFNYSGTISAGTLNGMTLIGGTISVPNATNPLFSVDSEGNMSAQDANISGSFNIESGKIGNWVIDDIANGGFLRDVDNRIVLNPTDKKIQLFNQSNELKAKINADDTLSNIAGGNLNVSGLNTTSIAAPSGPSLTSAGFSTITGTYQFGNEVSVTVQDAGEYSISGLFDYTSIPIPNLTTSGLSNVSTSTGSPNGYINVGSGAPSPYSFDGYYSSGISPRYAYQYFYLEIVDAGGTVIHREQISYAYARSGYSLGNYYTHPNPYGSVTNTGWQYQSGYSSAANSFSYSSISANHSFEVDLTPQTYKFRYSTVMKNRNGVASYLNGQTTTPTYTYYSHTKSGLSFSTSELDSSVTAAAPANFIELSGGGFQAATNSNQFVKIFRNSPTSYNSTLIQAKGGYVNLQQSDKGDKSLDVQGTSTFGGQVNIGVNWGSSFDNGKGYTVLKSPVFQYKTYSSGGAITSPLFIDVREASFFRLRATSTSNRYFELPHKQFASSTAVPFRERDRDNSNEIYGVDDFEVGHLAILFNYNYDDDACYIAGISGRADDNGWYTLNGGRCIMVVYDKYALQHGGSSLNTDAEGGWIIVNGDTSTVNSWA